jgi:RimJ/RimL family protein N-acetyltransferase
MCVSADLRLSDGRVVLRFPTLDDVPAHCEAVNESATELGKWLPWAHAYYSEEESRDWIASQPEQRESGQAYEFGVFEPASGRFLGCCGLNRIDPQNGLANLGYWVRTGASGRGVCTAAARLAACFGLRELGLQRIEITAAIENAASRRVADKLGAHPEGVLRKRFRIDGRPMAGALYSLTDDDAGLRAAAPGDG